MATKTERLEMRLSPELKELLEQAAALTGQAMTAFVRALLAEGAQLAIEKHTKTVLTRRDQARFLAMLDEKREPVEALKAAAKRYKARRG
ncbi:MAG: DUF1778 domain-containing protein [Myxococcota bacterium]